jgi:hypothetical protein
MGIHKSNIKFGWKITAKKTHKGAQQQLCRNLQRRTTSTVTISWHYHTRSTSLKYFYLKKEKN